MSTSSIVVYDETKVYADIEVCVKLQRGEAVQQMILQYSQKHTKGHTIATIGNSIQRNIYEHLREGYARLLDQIAESGKQPEDQDRGNKELIAGIRNYIERGE